MGVAHRIWQPNHSASPCPEISAWMELRVTINIGLGELWGGLIEMSNRKKSGPYSCTSWKLPDGTWAVTVSRITGHPRNSQCETYTYTSPEQPSSPEDAWRTALAVGRPWEYGGGRGPRSGGRVIVLAIAAVLIVAAIVMFLGTLGALVGLCLAPVPGHCGFISCLASRKWTHSYI